MRISTIVIYQNYLYHPFLFSLILLLIINSDPAHAENLSEQPLNFDWTTEYGSYDLARNLTISSENLIDFGNYGELWQPTLNNGDNIGGGRTFCGDLMGDGKPELLVNHNKGMTAMTLDGQELWSIPAGRASILADVLGDSKYEILVTNRQYISIYSGEGYAIQTYHVPVVNTEGIGIKNVIDIDNDGQLDLVCLISSGYGHDRRGVMVFEALTGKLKWEFIVGHVILSILPFDADGDGQIELYVGGEGTRNGNEINGYKDLHGYLWKLDTDGQVVWERNLRARQVHLMISDLNNDTKPDLVCYNSQDSAYADNIPSKLFLINPLNGENIVPEWNGALKGNFLSAVLGDFLIKPGLEIAGIENDQLYIWDSSLNVIVKDNTFGMNSKIHFSCDLDGDKQRELLITSNNKLFIASYDKIFNLVTKEWKWDSIVGDIVSVIPVDTNQNGNLELIVRGTDSMTVLGTGGIIREPPIVVLTPTPTPPAKENGTVIAEFEGNLEYLIEGTDIRYDAISITLTESKYVNITPIGDDLILWVLIYGQDGLVAEQPYQVFRYLEPGNYDIYILCYEEDNLEYEGNYEYITHISSRYEFAEEISTDSNTSGVLNNNDIIFLTQMPLFASFYHHVDFYTFSLDDYQAVTLNAFGLPFIEIYKYEENEDLANIVNYYTYKCDSEDCYYYLRPDYEISDQSSFVEAYLQPGKYVVIVGRIGIDEDIQREYTLDISSQDEKFVNSPLQVYGDGLITSADISPDGKYIVTGTESGWAVLHDAKTGVILRRFIESVKNTFAPITNVSFSYDGQSVMTASMSPENQIALWNVESGLKSSSPLIQRDQIILSDEEQLELILLEIKSAALTPDKSQVAIAGYWYYRYFKNGKLNYDKNGYGYSHAINYWNTTTNHFIEGFRTTDQINTIALSENHAVLVSGDNSGMSIVYDQINKEIIHKLPSKHTKGITSVAISPDDQYILTGSYDKQAVIWDVVTGLDILTVFNRYRIRSVAFTPNGSKFLVGNERGEISLYETSTGTKDETVFFDNNMAINQLFASDNLLNDKQFFSFSDDQTVKEWHIDSDKPVRQVFQQNERVYSVSTSSNNRNYVLTLLGDKSVAIWDAISGARINKFGGEATPYSINAAILTPNGNKVIAGMQDGTVAVWDINGNSFKIIDAKIGNIHSISINPNGDQVILGGATLVSIWNFENDQLSFIKNLEGHRSAVTASVVSKTGKYILTGSLDGISILWNTETQDIKYTLRNHNNIITTVAFSPDEKYALTGSEDTTVRLWDVESGNEEKVFQLTEAVYSVAFSPNRNWILVGSSSPGTTDPKSTATLWDIDTERNIRTFSGHTSGVVSVCFSPDGRKVITGSTDGTARSWEIDTPRVIILAGGATDSGNNNSIQNQTILLANYVYLNCLNRDYQKEYIRYLSSFSYEDTIKALDLQNRNYSNPSENIYKFDANLEDLKEAITQWAKKDILSPGRRLLIYLVDHGIKDYDNTDNSDGTNSDNNGENEDVLFRINRNETISAAKMNSWLNELQRETLNLEISLIVESCYSGMFVEQSSPPDESNRLVISSTAKDKTAIIMEPPHATSFSSVFWSSVYMGGNILESFETAYNFCTQFSTKRVKKDEVEIAEERQTPKLDDNGDGEYSEEDGSLMGKDYFGLSWAYAGHGAGDFPAFESVFPPIRPILVLDATTHIIDLKTVISTSTNPTEVIAVVRPPIPLSLAGEPDQDGKTTILTQSSSNPKEWYGKFEILDEGIYTISFIARYSKNFVSRPTIVNIYVGNDDPVENVIVKALLISGRGDKKNFSKYVTNYAKDVCLDRGYHPTNIQLMGYDSVTDKVKFENALSNLINVPTDSLNIKKRIFIFLAGDCTDKGEFQFGNDQTLNPEELIEILKNARPSNLQDTSEMTELILLFDFPYSGLFVEAISNKQLEKCVAFSGCSSKDENGSIFNEIPNLSFSYVFLSSAYRGENLDESYIGALRVFRDKLHQSEATSYISDFNDSIKLSKQWYIGKGGIITGSDAASLYTLFNGTIGDYMYAENAIPISVDLLMGLKPDRVYVITILKKDPTDLKIIDLDREDSSWKWSTTIKMEESDIGKYYFVLMADYPEDRKAEPMILTITNDTSIIKWFMY